MKRLITTLLTICLLLMFTLPNWVSAENIQIEKTIDDPSLLPYLEDEIYKQLIAELEGQDYIVTGLQAIYVSQEYIDELSYNSKSNIYFGYSIAELDALFEGTRYVFTVENNATTVIPFEEYYFDTYERILKNVAMGAGVIIICITVASITYATAPAVSIVFHYAAQYAMNYAVSGAVIGFATGGILRYIESGDTNEAFETGLVSASEGFKWGAITGAVTGAATETSHLYNWKEQLSNLSLNNIAIIQRESKYSIDFVKSVRSMDEYYVYRECNLTEYVIGDKRVLLPSDFDMNFVDPQTGKTNRELMNLGKNPVSTNGRPYEWHHVGQKQDSPLALLTKSQHNKFDAVLHDKNIETEVHGVNETKWAAAKKAINILVSNLF